LIKLSATLDYVLRLETKVVRNTSKRPVPFDMTYDPGAGTTTIDRQFALDSGYKIMKLPLGEKVIGIGGNVEPGYTIIPNLILDGRDLGPVYTHVIPFHRDLAERTLGLLGMNVLSWFKITQDCHWNSDYSRFDTATLELEPKFDMSDVISLDSFMPFSRAHRFGSAFVVDSANDVSMV